MQLQQLPVHDQRSPLPTRRLPTAPRLPTGWALYLMFGGLFVWWFLGLSGFVQAIFALPLLAALATRRKGVAMPRGFWFWLLFLGFVFASASQLNEANNALSWGWRTTIYLASTLIFLFVYNTSRQSLPAKTLVNLLAGFWALTVIGGLVGMALPNHTFHSLMQSVMPKHFQSNAFVRALIIPSTTGGKAFPGLGIYRVKAPFIYTNQWGSAFALTLPFAFAVISQSRRALSRLFFVGLLILSIVPLVFSLDRGSWLSAAAGSAYGVFRLAKSGRRGRSVKMARTARLLLFVGVVVGALVLVSPLGGYILARLNGGYGDQHRQLLYSSSLTLVARKPILGYGSPVALNVLDPSAPPGPSVGTHGTLWTVLVSNGVPAMAFFGLWFLFAWAQTRKRVPNTGGRNAEAHFWFHVVIFTAIIQLPYYELLPWGLPIVMIAAAAALRERAPLRQPDHRARLMAPSPVGGTPRLRT